MRELETNRLLIRPFATDDLDAFAGLMDASFGGPGGLDMYSELLPYYVLGERVTAQLRQPPYGDRAMVLKETGRLIGSVGFVPCLAPFGQLPFFGRVAGAKFSRKVGLFYAVLPEHRGRGLASEAASAMVQFAFDHLNLRRIGMTVENNPWPTPPWFQVVGVLES